MILSVDVTSKKGKRRGANRREQHSVQLKAEVIHDKESGLTQDAIAEKYRINRSLVSKWMKDKKKITSAAATAHKKVLKVRPGNKYNHLFSVLMTRFKAARSKGYSVDFNWLWCKARVAYREITGNPNATVRQHVITTFLKRHNIRMRTRQRNRKMPKQNFEVDLKKWHATTREKLVRTPRNDRYDEKWGRFIPRQRLNVDQSPLPFAVTTKRTYEHMEKGGQQHNHKVWISQPGSGLDKRQCTLQVCFRPTGDQPKLGIIFRGTGKRISEDEKKAYHPDIDVYFQENAWADTKVSVEWVEKTLTEAVRGDDRFVLFCDNLTGQVATEFKEAVTKLGGIVWYGLPGATDLWQPVDAGYAQILKTLIGQAQRKWLDDEENAEKWYGHETSFSAKERRILITHWAGEAYKKLLTSEYDNLRLRVWQKTGCLMTADTSEDDLIKPEGLKGYVVPPPSLLEPSVSLPQAEENIVTGEENAMDEASPDKPKQPEHHSSSESAVLEDKYDDRDFHEELVGRKVTALYENGWFTGTIEYYNTKLKEYKVNYRDDTSDFLSPDDFDGVEVILEPL